jgi:hypothetical protein
MGKLEILFFGVIFYLVLSLCYATTFQMPAERIFCKSNDFDDYIGEDNNIFCISHNDKAISKQRVRCKYDLGGMMLKLLTFQAYAQDIKCYWLREGDVYA